MANDNATLAQIESPDSFDRQGGLLCGLATMSLVTALILSQAGVWTSVWRADLEAKERSGAYWRMRGDISKYNAPNKLSCPMDRTLALAATPTRLAKMDDVLQERIINWEYALCDAGMRAWVDPGLPVAAAFPYPSAAI